MTYRSASSAWTSLVHDFRCPQPRRLRQFVSKHVGHFSFSFHHKPSGLHRVGTSNIRCRSQLTFSSNPSTTLG